MSARRFWSWGPVFAGLSAGNSSSPAREASPAALDASAVAMRAMDFVRGRRDISETCSHRIQPRIDRTIRGIPVIDVDATSPHPATPPSAPSGSSPSESRRSLLDRHDPRGAPSSLGEMLRRESIATIPGRGLPFLTIESECAPPPTLVGRRRRAARATVRESDWNSLLASIAATRAGAVEGGAA